MRKVGQIFLALAFLTAVVTLDAGAAEFSASSAGFLNLQHMTFQSQANFQNFTVPFQNQPAAFQENSPEFQSGNLGLTDFGTRNSRLETEFERGRTDDQDQNTHPTTDRTQDFNPTGELDQGRLPNMRMEFEDPAFQSLNFN